MVAVHLFHVSFWFLKVPSFMKKHTKNPLFEDLCYNLTGLELFSKMNFESSWVSEGLKIWKNMYFVLPYWFLASTLLSLLYKTKNEIKITNLQHSHIVWAIWKSLLLWNVVFGSLIGGGGEQVGKAPNALLQCSVPILIFLPEIYRKIVVTVIYMA